MTARAIWKYEVGLDFTEIDMPGAAKIVHIEPLGLDRISLWAEVDTESLLVFPRGFFVVGTGHPIPAGCFYVGTVVPSKITGLVWHLYVVGVL